MEPEVKHYFRKIISSFSVGLLWMLIIATAAFYFELALIDGQARWYNYLFYAVFIGSLVWLIRFYYKMWKH
jgi:hypothetical protein